MRLLDVDTGTLMGLKYKLIGCFKLAANMSAIWNSFRKRFSGKKNTTIEWDDGGKIGIKNKLIYLKSSHWCTKHGI